MGLTSAEYSDSTTKEGSGGSACQGCKTARGTDMEHPRLIFTRCETIDPLACRAPLRDPRAARPAPCSPLTVLPAPCATPVSALRPDRHIGPVVGLGSEMACAAPDGVGSLRALNLRSTSGRRMLPSRTPPSRRVPVAATASSQARKRNSVLGMWIALLANVMHWKETGMQKIRYFYTMSMVNPNLRMDREQSKDFEQNRSLVNIWAKT